MQRVTSFPLPRKNAKNLSDLPDIAKNELELIQVAHIEDVLDIAFVTDKPKCARKATGGTSRGKEGSPRRQAPAGQDPLPEQILTKKASLMERSDSVDT